MPCHITREVFIIEERINKGYTIIDSVFVGKTEFVLGENPNAPSQYVTWRCKDGDDYFWGNYMSDFSLAKLDLQKRVNDEIDHLRSIGAMPPMPISNSMAEAEIMKNHLGITDISKQTMPKFELELKKKKWHNEPER